jgi:hypothetical protein
MSPTRKGNLAVSQRYPNDQAGNNPNSSFVFFLQKAELIDRDIGKVWSQVSPEKPRVTQTAPVSQSTDATAFSDIGPQIADTIPPAPDVRLADLQET